MDAPAEPRTGSPAVVLTLAAGLVGLLLSLNSGGFALALFLAFVSLAALPMALADRPGAKAVRLALLGGGMAVLALVLVLGPLLLGEEQRTVRDADPGRSEQGPAVQPRAVPPSPSS